MLVNVLVFLAGLAALVFGADRFIAGASNLARHMGVTPLLIGMTVVGIGTSAPELLVSTLAAIDGKAGLAIGNAVGSNIANIGLILGATALIRPLGVRSTILMREYPVLLITTVLTGWLLFDGSLDRFDGAVLITGLVLATLWLIRLARLDGGGDALEAEFSAELGEPIALGPALVHLAIGLALLLGGARAMVWAAVGIAQSLGVSDLVIGLTIVAVGTSLPELAASVVSALRGEHDIAIGNVIGSNIYNLLAVLAVPAVLAPGAVSADVVWRDYPVMLAFTVVLWLVARAWGARPGGTNRIEGVVLLLSVIAYQGFLFWQVPA